MKIKIPKEVKQFWKSLDIKEKNQFLLLSISFRQSLLKQPIGNAGKFVEIPRIKKTYNSNIFVYESPWCETNLSFEFITQFDPLMKYHRKYILSSNNGSLTKYNELIDSWCKHFESYKIMNFEENKNEKRITNKKSRKTSRNQRRV